MSNFIGMLYKQSFWDWSSNHLLKVLVCTSSRFNSFSLVQAGKQSHMETRRERSRFNIKEGAKLVGKQTVGFS